MKKYVYLSLGLLLAIGLITMGTFSQWNKTVQSNDVVLHTGSLDVNVDGGPFTGTQVFELKPKEGPDFKPCYTGYIDFTIHNTGANPAVLWKHLYCRCENNPDDTVGVAEESNRDVGKYIRYDMTVGGQAGTSPGSWVGGNTVFTDDDNVRLIPLQEEDETPIPGVTSKWMPLGTLEPANEISGDLNVHQSYHLDLDTPRTLEGQTLVFYIQIYAEPRLGPGPVAQSKGLFLDNKTNDGNWDAVVDGTWGLLDWNDLNQVTILRAQGLVPGTDYTLIKYHEPSNPNDWAGTHKVEYIGHETSDASGKIFGLSNTVKIPSGTSAKIWLVPTSEVNVSLGNQSGKITNWDPPAFLFEANKVDIP